MLGLKRVHVNWCPFKSREPDFLKKLLAKGTINQAPAMRENLASIPVPNARK